MLDESGCLMSPLVRRTLAPCGNTPILKVRAKQREKVSITAALTISPRRRRLGLYWRTYPRQYVNSQRTAEFLRYLLRHLRGTAIVVWDGGSMHKGDPIRDVLHKFPRLSLERLPPYAPELNPMEYLWNHLKYSELANFAPDDVFQLDAVLRKHLNRTRKSPERLRSFIDASGLPFL
ncbi:MAG: transposase [Planctomycetota bacterium]